jgi:hypothetical protein
MTLVKRHNESHFYKYVSAESAKLVLSNNSFKGGCPLHFNDPFDVQGGLHFDFDPLKFGDYVVDRIESLVEAKEEPVFIEATPFSKAIKFIRSKKATHGYPKEELRRITQPLIASLGVHLEIARKDIAQEKLRIVRRTRILCLCENYKSVLMWSHYADHHRGVVFKLKVAETPAEDDPLWLVEKVEYVPKAAPLMTKDQAIDQILGLRPYDVITMYAKNMTKIKFDAWAYEKEWRLWTVADEGDDEDLFIKFNPNKFEAIYFGCNCSEPNRLEIMAMGRKANNSIRFYQAKKHKYEYELEFEEI